MSTRLQVVLDDEEMEEVRKVAGAQHMTVAEWVRQALRKARREQPVYEASRKIQVVREAAAHSFPAGSIDEMNEEIGRGYLDQSES